MLVFWKILRTYLMDGPEFEIVSVATFKKLADYSFWRNEIHLEWIIIILIDPTWFAWIATWKYLKWVSSSFKYSYTFIHITVFNMEDFSRTPEDKIWIDAVKRSENLVNFSNILFYKQVVYQQLDLRWQLTC